MWYNSFICCINQEDNPLNEELLRRLPKVDILLTHPTLAQSGLPYPALLQAARAALEEQRCALRSGQADTVPSLEALAAAVAARAAAACRPSLRRVVNATGIVLHTNLGRAPLAPAAGGAALEVGTAYSNLEYNLEEGVRGSRHCHAATLLRQLTGAQDALAVNNNAAAVFLMLSALARGKGVAISRGELVEIGGSFRIPDILDHSGARLVEVGTTNKTRLSDYAAALDQGAGAILKVHPSNFQVVGFTQEVALDELAPLARQYGVPLLYDLGGGALNASGPWPAGCPTAAQALEAGADVVCFSGDKLVGGPQAGIAVGRAAAIAAMRSDPFARVVRIDKLSLAALEATLRLWLQPEHARQSIPLCAMLSASPQELHRRAEELACRLTQVCGPHCRCTPVPRAGEAGGGTLPGRPLEGWAVALSPVRESAAELERALRGWEIPIIGYIRQDTLLLDVRTLLPGDDEIAAAALAAHWGGGAS